MTTVLPERPDTQKINWESTFLPNGTMRPLQRKSFRHSLDIYLKDSNATGNIYFARYFEWQGICRERWFHECISADMLEPLGVFVTKDAHQKYIHETFAFQRVDCELVAFSVRQCSFSLLFRFFVEGILVSIGHQQIVFADKEKKIARLPGHILERIRQFEDPCARDGSVF